VSLSLFFALCDWANSSKMRQVKMSPLFLNIRYRHGIREMVKRKTRTNTILLLLTGLLYIYIYLRVYNILVISPAPFLYLYALFFFLRTSLGDSFFFSTQSHWQRRKVGRNEIKALPGLQLVILFFSFFQDQHKEKQSQARNDYNRLCNISVRRKKLWEPRFLLYLSIVCLSLILHPSGFFILQ
jgi:hypothetical protein